MSTYTAKCDICGAENTVPSYGDWRCKQCGQGYEYDECHRISLTAAQWALLRNPPRWIPVSERLPEEYELVMVGWAGRRDIGKGYVLAGRWHDPLVGKPDVNQPTHWMPLPEPPEVTK